MQWLWRMKRINRSLETEVTDDNKASSNCWIPCNYCVTSAVPCFNFVCTSLGICLCFCACMYELAQLLCLCLFWMWSPTAIYLIFSRYDSSFDLEVINLYEVLPAAAELHCHLQHGFDTIGLMSSCLHGTLFTNGAISSCQLLKPRNKFYFRLQ